MKLIVGVTVALLGLILIGALPWLWSVSPAWMWLCGPLLTAWALWLILEYLKWARRLGKR